jgi:Rieske 2Fe-2S family protein
MTSGGILTAAESASVRREYRGASLLPKRTYHDAAVFDWERANVVRRDWVMVAREEDVAEAGTYLLVELDDDPLIIIRGRDGVLRAFHNVCRHRGTAVAEEPCGKVVRLQCPYHAWIYDLDGSLIRAKHTEDLDDFSFESYGLAPVRLDTWQGFIFLSLNPDVAPLADQLGDLVEHMARFDFTGLRSVKRIEYSVGANWKFIAENYSECYHCPGVHPQLNKLTPYDVGGDFDPNGGWQGGWMELAGDAQTMALDGGHGSRDGRPPMPGITPRDERCVYYYLVWPTTFLSIHPDYLLVHRLVPQGPGPHAGHLRMAVRGLDHRCARLRPERRDRLLGPDQRPGLARLRAAAAGHPLVVVGRRPLLEPGGLGPRLRPDGRRPLRGPRHVVAAHRARAVRPACAQDEPRDDERHERDRWPRFGQQQRRQGSDGGPHQGDCEGLTLS